MKHITVHGGATLSETEACPEGAHQAGPIVVQKSAPSRCQQLSNVLEPKCNCLFHSALPIVHVKLVAYEFSQHRLDREHVDRKEHCA